MAGEPAADRTSWTAREHNHGISLREVENGEKAAVAATFRFSVRSFVIRQTHSTLTWERVKPMIRADILLSFRVF
jgi:hypothetical protein